MKPNISLTCKNFLLVLHRQKPFYDIFPEENCPHPPPPNPKTNPNANSNPNLNRGPIFLWDNCPDSGKNKRNKKQKTLSFIKLKQTFPNK